MSTVASALAIAGNRSTGEPVRSQNGELIEISQNGIERAKKLLSALLLVMHLHEAMRLVVHLFKQAGNVHKQLALQVICNRKEQRIPNEYF